MNIFKGINNYYDNINKKKPVLKDFKNNHAFEKRFEEAKRIRKYPERIPIICERYTR